MGNAVSVPSFGDSFLCGVKVVVDDDSCGDVSVPSFGDSFLLQTGRKAKNEVFESVSVPSFGDSFLSVAILVKGTRSTCSFRPLIRGFFFINQSLAWKDTSVKVSVPSFGDSFLSCRYDMPPSLNIFAIFRRILHLLAQKGFPLTQSIHFSPYPSASARIKSFFIHIVPSPIPLNQYIITSSSFISPMPHDLTLV